MDSIFDVVELGLFFELRRRMTHEGCDTHSIDAQSIAMKRWINDTDVSVRHC